MWDRPAWTLQPPRGEATARRAGCLLLADDVPVLDLVASLVLVAGLGSPAQQGVGRGTRRANVFNGMNTR